MGWFKKKNPIVIPQQPEVQENPVSLQGTAPEEQHANAESKKKREQKNARKKGKDDQQLVVMGAKVQCSLCTCPVGTLHVVNPMVPNIQGKPTATEADNTKLSLVFTGTCTKSPNAAVPCAALITLGPWQNTGSLKIQDKAPLLKKSTVKCLFGGVDLKIVQSGQINKPKAYDEPTPEPEEKAEEVADLSLGIFFDGTLNNKNNTNARWKSEVFEKNADMELDEDDVAMLEAFNKNKKDKTSSYYNDYSNVARLWKYYEDSHRIYVEGIGTEDLDKDNTNAFGADITGVRGKVRKGCEKLAVKIERLAKKKTIELLELDIFGFSRGATAARNFVYEVGKAAYEAELKHVGGGRAAQFVHRDSDGRMVNTDILPEFGHLGLMLQKKDIKVKKIRIRFLGIFDSVSSYHEGDSLLLNALFHNFADDEAHLHLQQKNAAKRIVHFTAQDEHRANFALTRIHQCNGGEDFATYQGRIALEKAFPGVHCDIGGAYNYGEEEVVGLSTKFWGIDDLEEEKYRLMHHGWYTEDQLRFGRYKYSFIPLHFMCELGAKNKSKLPFERPSLENQYVLKDSKKEKH